LGLFIEELNKQNQVGKKVRWGGGSTVLRVGRYAKEVAGQALGPPHEYKEGTVPLKALWIAGEGFNKNRD